MNTLRNCDGKHATSGFTWLGYTNAPEGFCRNRLVLCKLSSVTVILSTVIQLYKKTPAITTSAASNHFSPKTTLQQRGITDLSHAPKNNAWITASAKAATFGTPKNNGIINRDSSLLFEVWNVPPIKYCASSFWPNTIYCRILRQKKNNSCWALKPYKFPILEKKVQTTQGAMTS